MGRKLACDGCRRRKIQCDRSSIRTSCDWCQHHDLHCTFDIARRGKSKVLVRHQRYPPQSVWTPAGVLHNQQPDATGAGIHRVLFDNVEYRGISDAEQELPPISYQLQPLTFPDTPSSRVTGGTLGHIHYGGQLLGQINLENGFPKFSKEGQDWIFSMTGERISFQIPRNVSATETLDGPREFSALPPQKTTESVLNAYLKSSFRLAFPLIDNILFAHTVTLAYRNFDGLESLEHTISRCCVLAFLSMTQLFRTDINKFPDVQADACALEAKHMLTNIMEEINITTLQSVLFLQQHETFAGRITTGITLHGVACRMVLMLGGHVDVSMASNSPPGDSRKQRQRRHLRTLFWICYVFDKEITLRTSHPPLLTDSYCDLTPPNNESTCLAGDDYNEAVSPYIHGDIGISHLKGKVSRLLYSFQASRGSKAEMLRHIRELDSELEEWRLSLPPDERPSLSISWTSPPLVNEMQLPHRMRVILIHLEYFYLLIAIHHSSGRCTIPSSQDGSPEGSSASVLKTSLSLALEASRSILFCLRETTSHLAAETFWVIQFYPTVAIVTLFLNILMDPLKSQARLDLELLSSAAKILRLIPVYQQTARRHRQVQMFEGFVFELVRLGYCAIQAKKAELAT